MPIHLFSTKRGVTFLPLVTEIAASSIVTTPSSIRCRVFSTPVSGEQLSGNFAERPPALTQDRAIGHYFEPSPFNRGLTGGMGAVS